jgi:coniferyl-aldehyde dehydrogenase
VNEFAKAFSEAMGESYPHLKANDDYTAIITNRQKERLVRNLEDASSKGADLLTINPSSEDLGDTRKLPMTLVLGATDDMLVMQEEIFGPILPVIPYDSIDEALAFVAARPRPLALYYFDWNKSRSDYVLAHSHSGGVCVNDTMSHVMSDDIPFGGIGPSGVGHYHGEEGFRTFSHAKGVVRKGRINAAGMIGPPWDNAMFKGLMSFQELRFRRRKIKD